MGNSISAMGRDVIWRDASLRVSRNLQRASHTKEIGFLAFPPEQAGTSSYDIMDPLSLSHLHTLMRKQAESDLWLVVSERGGITIAMEKFVISAEFVPVESISYAVSHRWGKEVILVNNLKFAVDWVGLIPDGRAWIDCMTHMNDPHLIRRTLECMGRVYVRCKVHAIYCIGGNEDVVECVFRGWMFQELSYVAIKDALRDWNDMGIGAWSLKMIGCLDQYDMHDLLVMTKSTESPNLLAAAVGASLRSFTSSHDQIFADFRSWIRDLPSDATSINLSVFKEHLRLTSIEPLASIGTGARLTEYMGIKLASLYKPFLEDCELRPVSTERYIDTLLNNLNMALYSQERDAMIATVSAYDVYLRENNDYKLAVKCAQFIEEEEYFIIEPKRRCTTLLLLEALDLLIDSGKFGHDKGMHKLSDEGVISWLSTRDQITIYYAGNRLSSWKKLIGGSDWDSMQDMKASSAPNRVIVVSENPEDGYMYADPTA